MKLTPLADRVVLKMTEAEETTKGGIILRITRSANGVSFMLGSSLYIFI